MRVRIAAVLIPLARAALPEVAAAGPPLIEGWVSLAPGESPTAVTGPRVGFAEGRRPGFVRVLGEADAVRALARDGRVVEEIPAPRRAGPPAGYRTPDDAAARFETLDARSDRVGAVRLGESTSGAPIDALWIGVPPGEGAPTLRVVGLHHGDEASSSELALVVAEALVDRLDGDDEIADLLDDRTVVVAPFVNPDGFWASTRHSAANVDLNRNYDYEWSAFAFAAGSRPFSEPETRAVRDHGLLDLPYASLSLHSGATNIGWVWNYTTRRTRDDAVVDALAAVYEDQTDIPGFYRTNGADWYTTTGDTNDWSYGRYGGLDFTVELSNAKTPPASEVDDVVAGHLDAVLAFLAVRPDVEGRVVDPDGAPVAAELVLRTGATEVSAPFFASPVSGRFARHGDVGATLDVRAPGFASTSVPASTTSVVLVPERLGTARCVPPVVSGAATVAAPAGVVAAATLRRPGASRVVAVVAGSFSVDATVEPGPWDLVANDGTAYPAALFVEGGGAARIDAVDVDDAAFVVAGARFGRGARAYALVGPRRIPTPVDVVGDDTSLVIDRSAHPDADVWLVVAGTHRLLRGPTGGVDTGDPLDTDTGTDTDTGDVVDDTGLSLERGACGWGRGVPASRWGLPLVPVLVLFRRRRS